jgi:hypothetical protein
MSENPAIGSGRIRTRLSGFLGRWPEAIVILIRLPGGGDSGPTLETYPYETNEPKPTPASNREGFSHNAFEVEEVADVLERILAHGGKSIAPLVTKDLQGIGRLTFVYARRSGRKHPRIAIVGVTESTLEPGRNPQGREVTFVNFQFAPLRSAFQCSADTTGNYSAGADSPSNFTPHRLQIFSTTVLPDRVFENRDPTEVTHWPAK